MRNMMTGDGWQLQGNAADAYERYLVPAIFDAMARRLVAIADVRPGDRVLDVACGTGVVARAAGGRVGPTGSITGVDINPDMLAAASAAAADVTSDIDWRLADAGALPFDDDTFDVVLCEEAVQFFPDPVAVLREIRRVATRDGTIAFSVLRPLAHNPVYAVFSRLLGQYAGDAAARMMASPFAFGDAGALRAAADEAGLTDVVVRIAVGEERFPSVAEFVRREAASSPLAGPLAALDDVRLGALVAACEDALAAHVDDTGLVFHNETHVVTARPGRRPT
ncbi:MAG TPA: methyltransferase domain-containing protein [Euzebyales bacterium]